MPKYPDIKVTLIGRDGNAMTILGSVRRAMKRARVESADIRAFTEEATSGDYDHLLRTVMSYVEVE